MSTSGGDGKNMREPDKDSRDQTPNNHVDASGAKHLDPQDKEMFLKAWNLADGEMTDLQILMAIKNGQL